MGKTGLNDLLVVDEKEERAPQRTKVSQRLELISTMLSEICQDLSEENEGCWRILSLLIGACSAMLSVIAQLSDSAQSSPLFSQLALVAMRR